MRKARKLDIACPNTNCRASNKLGLRNIIRFGRQPNRTQRYRCTECGRTFARTINTPFFHKHLSKKEITHICKLLAETIPYRGIARATGHHLDTIRSVADTVGDHCKAYNEYFVTELGLDAIEVDEMWSYVKKKKASAQRLAAKHAKSGTPTPTSA